MKRNKLCIASMLIGLLARCTTVCAQTPAAAPEDPAHQELRQLRDTLVQALDKRDIGRLLTCLHPNVVVTWQNAEVSRGREGVRAYLQRMLDGPEKVVESYSTQVKVDELTILYGGDTGIAFGKASDHFTLTSGLDFSLDGRWTATLVKENGQWLVGSVHSSTNLFDNPLLAAAGRTAYWSAAAGLLAGLALALVLVRRKKKAAA